MGGVILGGWAELQRVAFGVATRAGGGTGGGKSGGGSSSGRSSSGRSSSGGSGSIFSGSSGSSSSRRGVGGGSLGAPIIGLLILLVVVVVIVLIVRAAKKSSYGGGMPIDDAPGYQASSGVGLPVAPAAPTRTQLGDDPEAGHVTSRSAFNEPDFLSDCNRAFFTIQQAWTERKPDVSRQVMHDGIWQQHKFQIDQYLSQGKQNVLENLAVQNTRVVSVSSDPAFDTVMVRFFASCADYDVEVGGERPKVVRGDRTVRDWAEDWIFQRKAGATTKPNGGTMAKRCPNCGAPLDLDLAGECRYCRAPVMSGEFDWVLTRIEQLQSYEYAQATLPQ